MTEAYPLQWPAGRTRARYQERSRFKTTIGQATRDLMHEIRLMGAVNPVLSTNMRLRQDGLPYSNQRQPDDRDLTDQPANCDDQRQDRHPRWRLFAREAGRRRNHRPAGTAPPRP